MSHMYEPEVDLREMNEYEYHRKYNTITIPRFDMTAPDSDREVME